MAIEAKPDHYPTNEEECRELEGLVRKYLHRDGAAVVTWRHFFLGGVVHGSECRVRGSVEE